MSTFKTDPRQDIEKIEDAIYALTLASALETERRQGVGLPPTIQPQEGEDHLVSLINDPVNFLSLYAVKTLVAQLRDAGQDDAQLQDLIFRVVARIESETGRSVPISAVFH